MTLDSLSRQSFTDFEVIIVNDGSTDKTRSYLESVRHDVRVFEQPNSGPSAARNLGARHALGDYLAFLDSDDLWFSWTLEVFADLIEKHEHPSIIGAKTLEFRDATELCHVYQEQPEGEWFSDYFACSRKVRSVGAGMAVIKRELFHSVSGFLLDRMNCEDHDLVLRLGTSRGFLQVLTPYTLAYRRHSMSETSKLRRTYEGNVRLLQQESMGKYPGGVTRANDRHRILTHHIRPVVVASLAAGLYREGWRLYRATFAWHVRQARIRFLTCFPLLVLAPHLRKRRKQPRSLQLSNDLQCLNVLEKTPESQS
jgi:GT2 family glycosyltransferase